MYAFERVLLTSLATSDDLKGRAAALHVSDADLPGGTDGGGGCAGAPPGTAGGWLGGGALLRGLVRVRRAQHRDAIRAVDRSHHRRVDHHDREGGG